MKKGRKLDPKVDVRVKWMIHNKINVVAPTISPSKKKDGFEIESLEEALTYFKDYTDEVVLQPKWMGSYCCMYLFKNHSESYFVSRNGYKINHVEGLHEASRDIHATYFKSIPDLEWIMLEAELLPWSAMGKGLIDREFNTYLKVHESRLNLLNNTKLFHKVASVKSQKPWVSENLKAHEKRQYNSLKEIAIETPGVLHVQLNKYKEVLETFGQDTSLEFKVFNEVKHKVLNKEEFIYTTNQLQYSNAKDHLTISVKNIEEAYEFFDVNSKLKMEGIVVKPLKQNLINVAPCLKVRTDKYLQLIYGLDFHIKYDEYHEKRNTSRKLMQSITDYEIAIQLKKIPRTLLVDENYEYKRLLYLALDGQKNLENLDKNL